MRKFSERRIALISLTVSIISIIATILITIHFENKTNEFSQNSYCFDKVKKDFDDLNNGLYELPKLISGCAIAPSKYCGGGQGESF